MYYYYVVGYKFSTGAKSGSSDAGVLSVQEQGKRLHGTCTQLFIAVQCLMCKVCMYLLILVLRT